MRELDAKSKLLTWLAFACCSFLFATNADSYYSIDIDAFSTSTTHRIIPKMEFLCRQAFTYSWHRVLLTLWISDSKLFARNIGVKSMFLYFILTRICKTYWYWKYSSLTNLPNLEVYPWILKWKGLHVFWIYRHSVPSCHLRSIFYE